MARLAAVLLLAFGLLPIANWIPGGHEAPWYGDRISLWLSGGAILVGVLAIAAMVFNRHPALWREGAWSSLANRWHEAGRPADVAIATLAGLFYGVVSRVVLSAKPLLIDEVVQVWQARVFAAGKLFLPVSDHPEFTGVMHLVDITDKVFGQFPAGGPLMLSPGALVGAEWIVGPLFAAAGVFVFARLMRLLETSHGVALAALLIYAFAPFTFFLSGSMMNHVTATAWLLGAALALVHATRDESPRPVAALVMGLCLGIAATIRPLDAAAFALPAAAWLLWRLRMGSGQIRPLLLSGAGVALPIAGLLWVNSVWTGDPLRFGYIELWGVTHELGFHASPWGFPHTPARGVELVNIYLLRLQTYFLETPAPSLLFATGALLLTRRLSGFDRWMLAGSGLLLLSYFAYWHDGFYLGPRFLLPLSPWLALWTARLPSRLADSAVPLHLRRATTATGVAALLISLLMLVPIRWQQYRNGMLSMRWDVDAAARDAGVPDGALVLVRESFGGQLIARMWGLGVSRTDAEMIYRSTDSCELDRVLGVVESEGGVAERVHELIAPHRADSTRLVAQYLSPDTTLRTIPGAQVAGRCARRIIEDRAGTSLFAPMLLARDKRIEFVRDLHARDTLIWARGSGRPLWLVTQAVEPGSPLRFEPVNVDSAVAEWGMD